MMMLVVAGEAAAAAATAKLANVTAAVAQMHREQRNGADARIGDESLPASASRHPCSCPALLRCL